jgi:hypothetical protein
VERAVARELGLPLVRDRARATTVVDVRVRPGAEPGSHDLEVSYSRGGSGLVRVVAAPARGEDVPEAAALLAGNVARDESAALIATLTSEPEDEAPVVPPTPPAEVEPPSPPLPPLEAVSVSLFHPVAGPGNPAERHVAFEADLFYGRVAALSGVSLSLAGVFRSDGAARGVQLASIGYSNGSTAGGVRIGGVFGHGAGRFSGMALGGVVEVSQDDVVGAQMSGALALNTATVTGLQVGGAVGIAQRIEGLQLSLINVGGSVDGAQIGLVNIAGEVKGVQLGLVNVAREVKGVSLAFVPYSTRGRTQPVAWTSTTQPLNVGLRFYTGALYVMPSFGLDPSGGEIVYAPGLSLGGRIPLGPLFVDLDVNYSTPSVNTRFDEHNVDLHYRALLGWSITEWLGVFAGGGARQHFRTQGPSEHEVGPELSAGIELL